MKVGMVVISSAHTEEKTVKKLNEFFYKFFINESHYTIQFSAWDVNENYHFSLFPFIINSRLNLLCHISNIIKIH